MGSSAQCCNALSQVTNLAGKVFYPNNTVYTERLESYWSWSAALEPWCVVLPQSTDDAAAVMRTLSENLCPFGIRSGGHACHAGASGIHDGVTIDMGYMNTTTYDSGTQIAAVQPGSTWQNTYESLEPLGVAVTGGRAGIVGVGGYVTGGGYSFHLGTHGFACDNINSYEVVLGNGTVVNASAGENADLYRALKGSSGNLGLVTRLDMNTIDSPNVYGGSVWYDLSQKQAVFEEYINFVENIEDDVESQIILHVIYGAGEYTMRFIPTNSADVQSPSFDRALAIGNQTSTTLRSTTLAELVIEFSDGLPGGIYADWFTGEYANDIRMLTFIEARFRDYVSQIEAVVSPDSEFAGLIQFQPIYQAAVDAAQKTGGNVLGLEAVVADGPSMNWLVTMQTNNAEDSAKAAALVGQLVDEVDAYATSLGINHDWRYLNYAYGDQDVIGSYGAEALGLIRDASARYDPDGVFQNLRRTGFKIPT
ncbi:FAD-binding domain-containing protein [Xylariomycetidae sp. FL2044]|nr:FAD-binding domain-containing protein [Xylariomycetidae sp. FL2044]